MVQPQLLLKLVLTVSLLTRVTHSARETSVPCINLSAGDCDEAVIYMMSKICATKKISAIQAQCNTKPTLELYKSCVDYQCSNDNSQSNTDISNTNDIHHKNTTKKKNALNSDTKALPNRYKKKKFNRNNAQSRKEQSVSDKISSNTINQQNRKVKNNGGGNGGKYEIKNDDHFIFDKNKTAITHKPIAKKKTTRKGQSKPRKGQSNPRKGQSKPSKGQSKPRKGQSKLPDFPKVAGSERGLVDDVVESIDVDSLDLDALASVASGLQDVPISQISSLDDLLNYVSLDDIMDVLGPYPFCQSCMDTAHIYTVCMMADLCFSYITKPSLVLIYLSLIVYYVITKYFHN